MPTVLLTPEGAIVVEFATTMSKLLNLLSGPEFSATPPKRSNGETAGLDPVMASTSMTQLEAWDGVAQGSAAGINAVKSTLPFNSNGKLTILSLGLPDGVVKSIYQP